MEFNLPKTLKALLFSTSEPLAAKDIQDVFSRWRQQAEEDLADERAAALATTGEAVPGDQPPTVGTEPPPPSPIPADARGQTLLAHILAEVPSLLTTAQIRDTMDVIAQELETSGDVWRLVQGPAGWRVAIDPAYADWVRLLRQEPRPRRLSPAALETLAMVAYRQPVTRSEIEAIRGVSSDGGINRLIELELIEVKGRADLPGRPLQYGTTPKFLEFTGLKSLDELPASDVLTKNQIAEWLSQATQPKREVTASDVGLPEETAKTKAPSEDSLFDQPAVTEETTEA